MPADFDPGKQPEGMEKGERPEMPEGIEAGKMPEDFKPGEKPADMPQGMDFPGGFEQTAEAGTPPAEFYMQDKVNFFSGLQKNQ